MLEQIEDVQIKEDKEYRLLLSGNNKIIDLKASQYNSLEDDDNVLLESTRSQGANSRAEIRQPELFMSEKQQSLLALRRNFISGQADRRTMEIKRQIRSDPQNNKKSNRVSSYINNVGQYETEKMTEEDV